MNIKNTYKIRLTIGVASFFLSIILAGLAIILFQYNVERWATIACFVIAVLLFLIFVIVIPKTNEDGSPIMIKKKQRKYEHKQNKPVFNKEEWKEQEDEDDEMTFIEEVVEDD